MCVLDGVMMLVLLGSAGAMAVFGTLMFVLAQQTRRKIDRLIHEDKGRHAQFWKDLRASMDDGAIAAAERPGSES
jgi:hypothetical protein